MKKFIVYIHTFPNGKKYIGITCKKPNQRWENGKGYSETHQNVMYKAIQKYGWENVTHEIVYTDLSLEEAKEKEKELIKKYNTYVHAENSNGYNMTLGGEGTTGHVVSEEARIKMSSSHVKKTGKMNPNSRVVVCDGIEYESLTIFRQKFNVTKNVSQWLLGKVGMPKEWYDKKLHYKDLGFDIVKCSKKHWRNTIEYDGKVFESQAECAKYIGVSPSALTLWLNGTNPIPKHIKDKGLKTTNKI